MTEEHRIAIVGMGCNFPGGSEGWKSYWDFLEAGEDGMLPVPENRWDWRKFTANENPAESGKTFLREGGFLAADIFKFDPQFFGISFREAETLDPQQRLMLEVTYQALEDAGMTFSIEHSENVGVFVGAFTMDNLVLRNRSQNRHNIEPTDVMGFSMTLLANRLSHAFNWTGPSITIDTACSSSLVAVHQACQSIIRGECPVAVAGGVNIMLAAEASTMMSRGGFLSPTCRCHTFDSAADGYARGEGAGVVILKSYEKAVSDGDSIHAVIRGTGVNHDGRTAGIALPDSSSQIDLLKEIYSGSHIDPAMVDYVEAHGTGTIAGDSAEIDSIHAVFNETGTSRRRPLVVASVKTNFGHLEAAAGIAALIKAVLCLKHRSVPAHLHLNEPNPKLMLAEREIEVPRQLISLRPEGHLLAGINSFGYGGTNAHVVIQSVEKKSEAPRIVDDWAASALSIVSLSAHSDEALRVLARSSADWLNEYPDNQGRALDWAYTHSCRRSRFGDRLTLPFQSPAKMADALKQYAEEGVMASDMAQGRHSPVKEQSLVYVCTGMGPQWWGMGQSLLRESEAYSDVVEDCDVIFEELAGWSILEAMQASEAESRMGETQVAQPANVVLQIGIAAMWKQAGIEAGAVVGHSVGEVTAAYLAGALTLKETILVSYHRSRLQQSLSGSGTMLAIGIGETAIAPTLEKISSELCLAAINSPDAVTVAGPESALKELKAVLDEDHIFNSMLEVEIPYHSKSMNAIRTELTAELRSLKPQPTKIPLYSTVTGELIRGEQMGAGYWWNNVRRPVRFQDACESLLEANFSLFLEVGAHPVLRRSIQETADAKGMMVQLVGSLSRKEPEIPQLQRNLGCLSILGFSLPWHAYFTSGNLVPLPLYRWQRTAVWRETIASKEDIQGRDAHVFLQGVIGTPDPAWEVEINRNYFPYVDDHKIQDATVWSGAAYIEAGLALNLERFRGRPTTLTNLSFSRMLPCGRETGPTRLMTSFNLKSFQWTVSSANDWDTPNWQEHATGRILESPLIECPQPIDIKAQYDVDAESIDPAGYYERLHQLELHYGPAFHTITELLVSKGAAWATLSMNESTLSSRDHYQIHPTLLDGAFQAFMVFAPEELSRTWVPVAVRSIHFFKPGQAKIVAHLKVEEFTTSKAVAQIQIFDPSGNTIALLEGATFRPLPALGLAMNDAVFLPRWSRSRLPVMENPKSKENLWIVFSEPSEWAHSIFHIIEAQPDNCCRWVPLGPDTDLTTALAAASISMAEVQQCIYLLDDKTVGDSIQSILQLLGLLKKWSVLEGCELTVVTRNLQSVGDALYPINPNNASAWGLAGVIANEYPEFDVRLVDLPQNMTLTEENALVGELSSELQENEVALRDEDRWLPSWRNIREERIEAPVFTRSLEEDSEFALLKVGADSALDSLHHVAKKRCDLRGDEVEVQVHSVGLNFKDLLKATGRVAPMATEGTFFENSLGLECSGTITRVGPDVRSRKAGDRVGAFAKIGCFASYVVTDESFTFLLSETASFDEGACMVPWCTAYYALVTQARITQGESVLIHSGAGGVGLAAIQIAKQQGAIVFASASTQEKRDYLIAYGVDHVLDSTSLAFGSTIRNITQGSGVDVILNALSGEMLRQSFELLAPYGRFVEIGKRDIIEDQGLAMGVFNRNAAFIAIDLDRMLKDRPHLVREALLQCFEHIDTGRYRPLPTEVIDVEHISQAFRTMASRDRIGRVSVSYAGAKIQVVDEDSRCAITDTGCYLITGGTSGLGLELARSMAESGAGQVVLASRSGAVSEAATAVVTEMTDAGTEVWAPKTDISEEASVIELIDAIKQKGWILKGVVHCALVLEDGFLKSISEENLENVFGPKVKGAQLLDIHTRELSLDFWIAFSSIATLLGSVGQGCYVAANACLEQMAVARQQAGFPAMTVILGYLADTGVASRNAEVTQHLKRAGLKGMQSKHVSKMLLPLASLKEPVVGFFEIDWNEWSALHPKIAQWTRFQEVLEDDPNRLTNSKLTLVREALMRIAGEKRGGWIKEQLLSLLSEITLIPANKIMPDVAISNLGIDSLMVLELIGRVKRELGVTISNREFLHDPSVDQLSADLLTKLGF